MKKKARARGVARSKTVPFVELIYLEKKWVALLEAERENCDRQMRAITADRDELLAQHAALLRESAEQARKLAAYRELHAKECDARGTNGHLALAT